MLQHPGGWLSPVERGGHGGGQCRGGWHFRGDLHAAWGAHWLAGMQSAKLTASPAPRDGHTGGSPQEDRGAEDPDGVAAGTKQRGFAVCSGVFVKRTEGCGSKEEEEQSSRLGRN